MGDDLAASTTFIAGYLVLSKHSREYLLPNGLDALTVTPSTSLNTLVVGMSGNRRLLGNEEAYYFYQVRLRNRDNGHKEFSC